MKTKIGKVYPTVKATRTGLQILISCGLLKPCGNYYRWI